MEPKKETMMMGRFDMLSTAEFLREMYMDHGEYVVYPPGKENYTGEEFIAYMCEDLAFYKAVDTESEILALEPLMLMLERELQRHDPEDRIIIEVGHLKLDMNKMNLENLQDEMRTLKFDKQLIEQMEKEMAKGQPGFQLFTQLPADKGQLEVALNFKRSGSSEYYFLNRYDLSLSRARPLEEGKSYMVISPDPEKQGKHLVKKFESAARAIDYFKSQKQSSELAMGKSAGDKMTLASMANGKVEYVNKEFRKAYYSPVVENSQFVDRGRGFNVEQAANMLQGRAAYRNDLVNRGTDEMYSAWNVFEFNEARDRYGNHKIKQYGEGYGFDVQKELNRYDIRELAEPKKEAELLAKLRDGHSPVVTVVGQDGQEHKLRIEAMPRYTNFNFYQLNGKIEKREQFLKEPTQGQQQANIFEKKLNQQKDQSQGMAI
ncbi:hypothetical protein ACQKCH_11180 [Nubsella zeaxanthinifaciens]|uniref:hypothetical protein n=1 Tax=Nubsella zeaxanthinifaciens TaxID=392412 RepID=UPI003D04BB97